MLSIIIPAYNEEKRIVKTLEKITSYLKSKKYDYEIIIVDDGSNDNTRQVVQNFKNIILTEKRHNKGKGYSIKEGMLLAKGDYLLFSDADLSTPIEELDKFMEYIEKYNVVIGSRALKGSDIKVRQPFYREYMGKVFNLFVQTLAIKGIKDTQCGFKMFTKQAAKKIFSKQKIEGFGFDVEVLFLAKKFDFNIKETPVTWVNSANTTVSPIKDSIKMFLDLFKVRLNDIKGEYK
jgi:dolichyl-phosphate beta-glucosyltransferase